LRALPWAAYHPQRDGGVDPDRYWIADWCTAVLHLAEADHRRGDPGSDDPRVHLPGRAVITLKEMRMYDLLLRRARLVDDTIVDIAVQDGQIAAIGEIDAGAVKTLDLNGE